LAERIQKEKQTGRLDSSWPRNRKFASKRKARRVSRLAIKENGIRVHQSQFAVNLGFGISECRYSRNESARPAVAPYPF
jgi:hypothetical protein